MVLALGNDILGDDGVGFHAARSLGTEFPEGVDVVETGEAGLALLDHLEGYDRAVIVDAIATGRCAPGTVLTWRAEDFRDMVAPSPHFAGLPELFHLAQRVGMHFPQDIRVIALEVADPTVFRETLTPQAQAALPAFVAEARRVLSEEWGHAPRRTACTSTL
ncbi:MAG: hydrogenase maturation protease [Elusimicrobiota bacterium]